MAHEAGFNFHRPKAVAADFDNVVHTALNAEVAHGIFCRGVARKVHTLDGIPVGFVTIRVAKDSAHRGRPRVAYDQEATSVWTDRSAVTIHDISLNRWERPAGAAGLEG